MKHGNAMKLYKILRSHDFKVFAQIRGYEFALQLQILYENAFPQNKFIITDKNQKVNERRRIKNTKSVKSSTGGKNVKHTTTGL
jgi:hypothetical protein